MHAGIRRMLPLNFQDEEAIDISLCFPFLSEHYFRKEMRGYICSATMDGEWGDLGGIIRSSGYGDVASTSCNEMIVPNTQSAPVTPNFLPPAEGPNDADFGSVPFSDFGDPLLREFSGGTTFFDRPDPLAGLVEKNEAEDDAGAAAATVGGGCGDSVLLKQNFHGVDETKRPCNIFSRVLQLSPGLKASSMVPPRGIEPSAPVLSGVTANVDTCRRLDEGGLQISSPRAPGVKRRKNQAKKVVYIPAPAVASSKPGGEVVPSDLWAWRKYGQKPIKGSPYPRSYYRCSSSKGCLARKQVERSRIDPNMLVITYTSDHNHPWPTQRKALAGSTRSLQPARISSSAPKSSPLSKTSQATEIKEEPKVSPITAGASPHVKEEARGDLDSDHVRHRSSEPTSLPETSQSDDFFADLGELESDPTSLVFSKEFLGDQLDAEGASDPMNPFSLFV